MQRLKTTKRIAIAVVVVSLLAAIGIAFLKGGHEQEFPEHDGAANPSAQHTD